MRSKNLSKKITDQVRKKTESSFSGHPFDGIEKKEELQKDKYTEKGAPFDMRELRREIKKETNRSRGGN